VRDSSDFWAFVLERDAIRLRRERGDPEPWTDDPLLRSFHFTNVHRRHDPGTKWFLRLVAARGWADLPEVLWATYAYRSLNRVSTFEALGFPWPDEPCVAAWSARLDAARAAGAPLGSARHLTYWARLRVALPWLTTHLELVASVVAEARTGADVVRALGLFPLSVGVFLGTQVTGDLAEAAPDGVGFGRDVSVPVSGGSRYGLRMIEGTLPPEERARGAYNERDAKGRRARELSDDPAEEAAILRLLAEQPAALSEPLTRIDLEHSLCEFARYSRLASGDDTRVNYLRRSTDQGIPPRR
jgi:hypothetical protein